MFKQLKASEIQDFISNNLVRILVNTNCKLYGTVHQTSPEVADMILKELRYEYNKVYICENDNEVTSFIITDNIDLIHTAYNFESNGDDLYIIIGEFIEEIGCSLRFLYKENYNDQLLLLICKMCRADFTDRFEVRFF